MRAKRWILRLSSVGAVLATACAMSCSVSCMGDDVLELDVFDGGFDGTTPFDAGADTSSALDAASDTSVIDASGDAASPIDSGTDSGIHVVIDSGSDSGGTDSGFDAGDDSGSIDDAGDAGDGGDGSSAINGCVAFEDDTDPAASRVIQGPADSAPVQFTPNCMKVHAGQSVIFQQADFSNHPLMPANGDTPNPIVLTSSGTTVTFAFPNAGTYGFECEFHPSIMFGAIEVTP
jgi:plastocyanin